MSWRHAGLLIACALVPYLATWSHGFVDYDDGSTIVGLQLIRGLSWARLPEFFRPDIHPGLPEYMPLKNLSYALDYRLFGLSPRGFRVQQQLWFAASVLLLWVWLRELLARLAREQRLGLPAEHAAVVALVSAALFALHPVHVESVTWLSGRKDVLAGAFMLAALYCALRHEPGQPGARRWLLAALSCTALALLAKPVAVMLPALALLQDAVTSPSAQPLRVRLLQRALLHGGIALLCVGFAGFYLAVVHAHAAAYGGIASQLFAGPGWLRWGQQLAAYAGLALAPLALVPLYPPDLLDPRVLSLRGLGGLLLLVLAGAALVVGLRRRHVLGFALGLFALPIAPQLIAPAWGQYVAARYLYLSVAGALLALVWCGARLLTLRPHLRRVLALGGALFALFLLFRTLDYNRTWRDPLSLWTGAHEVYPRFTLFHDRAARAAFAADQPELALQLLSDCVRIDPRYADCAAPLGGLLLVRDPPAGERMLRGVLAHDRTGLAHLRLAQHLVATDRADEGLALYQGWLNGRGVGMDQIEALAWLALRAKRASTALGAVRQSVRAGAVNHPAGPPPVELLRELARASSDPALSRALTDALARCTRVDCVQRALNW